MTNPNDILMGGGIPAAKFETLGTAHTGTITALDAVQQTDFKTGELLTWKDGSPRMQVVATIATALREDPEDDGLRKLYIKGKNLTEAVRNAVRAAGAKGLSEGGTLTVTYTGDGVPAERGLSAPKLYTAVYVAPAAVAANDALGLGAPAPAAAAPAAAPAPAVAATEPSPADTARALLALGQTTATVAAATGLDESVVVALSQLGQTA